MPQELSGYAVQLARQPLRTASLQIDENTV
jgi:hypothetical protein